MATINLGGKDRTLRFDLGEWEAIETQGTTLDELLERFGKGPSFTDVRILVWAMLSADGATKEDVRRWITGQNFGAVMSAVGEMIRETFPHEGSANPPTPGVPSASPPSGNGSTPVDVLPADIAVGVSATV
jgi:hypothetical protein